MDFLGWTKSLEHFSTIDTGIATVSHPCSKRHAVFYSIFSNNSKQDAATTAAHRNKIIQLLRERNFINAQCSTIWENTDELSEKYRSATSLHLFSILSQSFNIIIDHGISAPVHGKEVVDGFNSTDKRPIFHLINTLQMPGNGRFDS